MMMASGQPVLSEQTQEIRRFICIDVDRTVLKTKTLFDRCIQPVLYDIAEEQAADSAALNHRRQVIETLVRDMDENIGKSFDFLAAYNERIDDIDRLSARDLADRVIDYMSGDGHIRPAEIEAILAPRAIEVLVAVDETAESAWGFLTSGGIQTQSMKLCVLERIFEQVADLPLRAQIISTEHKTRDVDTVWRQPDGRFRIPRELTGGREVIAGEVVVVDDKAKNLLADNYEGITTILVEQLDMPPDDLARRPLAQALLPTHTVDK